MSEEKRAEGSEEPVGSSEEQRLAEFTRRALVRAGWTAPIILAASLPAHAQQSPHDDAHADSHSDAHDDHDDAGHQDSHDDVHNDAHDDVHNDVHNDVHTDVHTDQHDDHDDAGHEDAHQDVHDDVHTDVHDDVHSDVHSDVHEDVHNDVHEDVHDDVHTDVHDDVHDDACTTVGQFSCSFNGTTITFTATAVMTEWAEKCQESAQFTECCDEAETVRFVEPCECELTLSHDYSGNLDIKVEYFTFLADGCTNQSSFGDVPFEDVPPTGMTVSGSIQGDSPECTGFRIVEVKDSETGAELCKPDPCPQGDLGIYAILLEQDAECPEALGALSISKPFRFRR